MAKTPSCSVLNTGMHENRRLRVVHATRLRICPAPPANSLYSPTPVPTHPNCARRKPWRSTRRLKFACRSPRVPFSTPIRTRTVGSGLFIHCVAPPANSLYSPTFWPPALIGALDALIRREHGVCWAMARATGHCWQRWRRGSCCLPRCAACCAGCTAVLSACTLGSPLRAGCWLLAVPAGLWLAVSSCLAGLLPLQGWLQLRRAARRAAWRVTLPATLLGGSAAAAAAAPSVPHSMSQYGR